MRQLLFGLLALVAITATAQASGYTYSNGYYWSGGTAYERQTAWYWDGCCWRYYYTYSKSSYQTPAAATTPKGWRQQLLEIASDREENRAYLEGLKALGLSAPAQAYTGSYSLYGTTQTYTSPYAAQGQTVVGYDQLSTAYPDIDLKLLYNQANQLAVGAQGLTDRATGDFQSLVSQESDRRAKVAEILARAQAATQLMQSFGESKTTKSAFAAVPTPATPPQQAAPDGGDNNGAFNKEAFFNVLATKCISCHSKDTKPAPAGGLDLLQYFALSAEKRQAINDRLVTDDADKRMPRKADGTPGERLPWQEVILFVKAASIK